MHFCAKNQNIHKPDGRGDLDHVQIHRLNVFDGVVMVVVGGSGWWIGGRLEPAPYSPYNPLIHSLGIDSRAGAQRESRE